MKIHGGGDTLLKTDMGKTFTFLSKWKGVYSVVGEEGRIAYETPFKDLFVKFPSFQTWEGEGGVGGGEEGGG